MHGVALAGTGRKHACALTATRRSLAAILQALPTSPAARLVTVVTDSTQPARVQGVSSGSSTRYAGSAAEAAHGSGASPGHCCGGRV